MNRPSERSGGAGFRPRTLFPKMEFAMRLFKLSQIKPKPGQWWMLNNSSLVILEEPCHSGWRAFNPMDMRSVFVQQADLHKRASNERVRLQVQAMRRFGRAEI